MKYPICLDCNMPTEYPHRHGGLKCADCQVQIANINNIYNNTVYFENRLCIQCARENSGSHTKAAIKA